MSHLKLAVALFALGAAACGSRPPVSPAAIRPDQVLDFASLYAANCAGCHGTGAHGGAAQALGDPVYLAIAGDTAIRAATAKGVAGTSMPAFAQNAGGMLTDSQVNALVAGIRSRWGRPGFLQNDDPPPYTVSAPGDGVRGAAAYQTFCSSCHGAQGRGGVRAGSIVDSSFLALVSDQGLRTTVIVGRPDLGAPDWRGDLPGKPMSAQDVSDVVAWLSAQRPQSQLSFVGGTP